jgi:D-glycero-D-manno-heptose 1,7-bisphosphate phosphatase
VTRRFALIDRDGTINEERHYVRGPDELSLIPGSAAAVVRLRDELHMGVVVVTNQAEVGRGRLAIERLDEIHARLCELLAAEGASVDAIEWCPHRPEDGCGCRKPRAGMVRRAVARFGFDPSASFVVGDHTKDMAMGRAVGATTVLVRTGHGAEQEPYAGDLADHVADDLADAVTIIADALERER